MGADGTGQRSTVVYRYYRDCRYYKYSRHHSYCRHHGHYKYK